MDHLTQIQLVAAGEGVGGRDLYLGSPDFKSSAPTTRLYTRPRLRSKNCVTWFCVIMRLNYFIFSFQLKSDPKRFFQNRLNEQKIRMENTLQSIGSVMSRYRWEMRPTQINAYYSPQNNKIGEYEFPTHCARL